MTKQLIIERIVKGSGNKPDVVEFVGMTGSFKLNRDEIGFVTEIWATDNKVCYVVDTTYEDAQENEGAYEVDEIKVPSVEKSNPLNLSAVYRKNSMDYYRSMKKTGYTSKTKLAQDLRANGFRVVAILTDEEIEAIKDRNHKDHKTVCEKYDKGDVLGYIETRL